MIRRWAALARRWGWSGSGDKLCVVQPRRVATRFHSTVWQELRPVHRLNHPLRPVARRMILKGKSRKDGVALADYLLNVGRGELYADVAYSHVMSTG